MEGVRQMARFYDAVDLSELASIEAVLKSGGVEYSLSTGEEECLSEILVAEEDLAYAEKLLTSANEGEESRTAID